MLGRDELVSRLVKAVPELGEVQMLWGASSGSHIFVGEEEMRGLRGQRLYIAIADGADAMRVGRTIYHRLWLAGEGFIHVGAAGQKLERTLIDLHGHVRLAPRLRGRGLLPVAGRLAASAGRWC